jgi:hypothetical protein
MTSGTKSDFGKPSTELRKRAALSAIASMALTAILTWTCSVHARQHSVVASSTAPADLSVKPVRDLFVIISELPTKDFWWALSAISAAFAALFGVGYYFGRQKQEHDHALAKFERDSLKTNLERMQQELHEQNRRVAVTMNAYSGLDSSQIEAGTFVREASQLEAFKQKMLASARHRIWYFGASFHVTTSMHRKSLLERVKSGVDVRVMFSDPEGSFLKANAASFGQTLEELDGEIRVTHANLDSLRNELSSEADERLQFRVVDEVFTHGVYMYDLDSDGGGTIVLVPHVWGNDAPAVPGIIIEGSMGRSVINAYRLMFESKWKRARRLGPTRQVMAAALSLPLAATESTGE